MNLAERVANLYLAQQVAEKYAATRPLKPEKLQELLLKLRKGSGTSMKFGDLFRVLNGLGGWKITPEPELGVGGETYRRWGEKLTFTDPDPKTLEDALRKAKSEVVSTLPVVGHVRLNHNYRQDVSEIHPLENYGDRRLGFSFQMWEGVEGTLISGPSGAQFAIPSPPHRVENDFAANGWGRSDSGSGQAQEKFWAWLMGASQFLKQVNEFLGTETYEAEKARKKIVDRNIDNTGTCPVCFGNFKLTPKSKEGTERDLPGMILHGYKRPGQGYIIGNCFGQDWPPFELSCAGTKAWREVLLRMEKGQEASVARLKSGEVEEVGDPYDPRKTVKKNEVSAFEWERALKSVLEKAQTKLTLIQMDLKKMTKAISSWEVQDLPRSV